MKNLLKITSAVAFALTGILPSAHSQLSFLSNFAANQAGGVSAGEITAFDPNTNRLFVTSSGRTTNGNPSTGVYRINIFGLTDPTAPTTIGTVDFTSTFGAAADTVSLSSVAVDPLGRFGAATIIPTDNTGTLGKVGFFNLSTGDILGTADVGHHPDSVTFSADGNTLVVVNEGEFKVGSSNAPGSISVFNLAGITTNTVSGLSATTKDFSAGNLDVGVTINSLRNSNDAVVAGTGNLVGTTGSFNSNVPVFATTAATLEPEYATIRGNSVFVSLQDNNAIAEYDLTTNLWTKVTSLGTITQVIDARDTSLTPNSANIDISKTVKGLPMPDAIASYEVNGKTYVISANEGDARVDDRDISRFGDISGNDSMNPLLDSNYPANATGVRSDAELGRLNVSRIDGDTDNDGKIDDITMIGTRSMSIWEKTASGLVRVSDTGSLFEQYIRDNDAAGWLDSRSDDKGPEPEGLTIGTIGGVPYAFVVMERTNSIFQLNISNPLNPFVAGYIRITDPSFTPQRPEGVLFVSAADSPNGQDLVIVSYEGIDSNNIANNIPGERIVVLTAVPEASTYAFWGMGVAAMLMAVRMRRKKVS